MLRYSVLQEVLYGSVGSKYFMMKAFSGGGRGSTGGLERHDLSHWDSGKKAPSKFNELSRGGPLPDGPYLARYLSHHAHFGQCVRLEQTLSALLQPDPFAPCGMAVTDRTSFYIHGTGPKGSDGCIVPADRGQLKALLAAITSVSSPVMLLVHSQGFNPERQGVVRGAFDIA